MQRWSALGCRILMGNFHSDFWIFFSVFLTFCQRTTKKGGLGKHCRRAGLKDVGIRAKGDVCSTRVWMESEGQVRMKGGLEAVMGLCALWGIGQTFL
jgi:hypothetical protein